MSVKAVIGPRRGPSPDISVAAGPMRNAFHGAALKDNGARILSGVQALPDPLTTVPELDTNDEDIPGVPAPAGAHPSGARPRPRACKPDGGRPAITNWRAAGKGHQTAA
jgi:hypothetical protein